ncbi:MAG: sulfate ABC transporter ATP-binding protein [Alphaproteobacteria bacterium]|nr:sulfate ABC transporter ATP-binding protein [Alphaproteobacteria bacterium]
MSIIVRQIHKTFGSFTALDNVNLEARSGELLAILGPSGSGKTSLLRIIAGLEFPDSGSVLFDGEDALEKSARDRKVGFVFQHYAMFRHMTVFDNVAFGLQVRPRHLRPSKAEIRKKVMRLLDLVQLEQFADRYPHQLSGGQRQRVALARVLAIDPKVLLLDEPFGALDAKVRKELRRWLRRLHDEMHVTSVFVTHDQEEAMEVADRVVVMNHGRIEQIGTPEEVYHHPASGFVYDFLGNYNAFEGWKDDSGNLSLSREQLKPKLLPAPVATVLQPSWLSRYPALRRMLGRVAPFVLQEKTPPASAAVPLPATRAPSKPVDHTLTPVTVFARPHEMEISLTRDHEEFISAKVGHINPAGPLVKLELERDDGRILQAEVPHEIVKSLKLSRQQSVYVRPRQTRVFEA